MGPRAPGVCRPSPRGARLSMGIHKKGSKMGVRGACPRMVPYPLGEKGGHPRNTPECVMGKDFSTADSPLSQCAPSPFWDWWRKREVSLFFNYDFSRAVMGKKVRKVSENEKTSYPKSPVVRDICDCCLKFHEVPGELPAGLLQRPDALCLRSSAERGRITKRKGFFQRHKEVYLVNRVMY
jgi:hypothetical protein